MNLYEFINNQKIIICVGSGGVGKTTTAAAIALKGAIEGKKVIVLTIDPAKRLANSIGLKELGNEETLISNERFKKYQIEVKGSLYAMMLDTKHTFDEMIKRLSPSESIREKILNNHYYKHLSTAVVGSHEYMAAEKLYELYNEDKYDLYVLDTPPTKYALDFLQGPKRIADFLDEGILKWFLKPYFIAGKVSLQVAQKGTAFLFNIAEKLTGLEVLSNVSEFFLSFKGLYSGFKDRAEKVNELLRDNKTVFLLVTSPNKITIDDSLFFYKRLKNLKISVGGVIINKVHRNYYAESNSNNESKNGELFINESKKEIEELTDNDELKNNLYMNFSDFQTLAQIDEKNIGELKKISKNSIIKLPYFDTDIYDLDGLDLLNKYLFS